MGQVRGGSKRFPLCIPGNCGIIVLGWTSKVPSGVTYKIEQAEHHNLSLVIIPSRCLAIKSKDWANNSNKYNYAEYLESATLVDQRII